jgi:LPXTG-motif cell wall-anchored protein
MLWGLSVRKGSLTGPGHGYVSSQISSPPLRTRLPGASCVGGAASNTVINNGGGSGSGNAGSISALSGDTANAPVSMPVNVCGVSAAVAGFANSGCQGGSFSNVITPPGGGQPTPCPPPPPTCTCTPPPGHHHTPPPPHHGHTPPPDGHTPPPGGGTPPGNGTPPGSQGGGTTTTVPGSLPITGADLLGIGIAAVGALGIGGASLVIARRRRNSEV